MDHSTQIQHNLQVDVQEIKTGLELVKHDIKQFFRIIDKIDITNDKIQDLINNIGKIMTLQEQKITDTYKDVAEVWSEMDQVNKRISSLENYRWILVGGITLAVFAIGIFAQVWSK